jgi:hypothetical protein
MFRALTYPSSGGKIVLTQHQASSLSANVCTVHRLRADYFINVFEETTFDSEHVEDNNVTNILLLNKELCIKLG